MAAWVPDTTSTKLKTIVLTAFLVGAMLVGKAQTPIQMETQEQDKIAINQLLDSYFNSIYEGDVQALGKLFHPGALLFGDVKGQPYAKTLDAYLDGVANRQSPKDLGKPVQANIISIDLINSIAVAKFHLKMYEFNYDEFLSLHKIEGKWFIVNKMFSDINP